MSKPATILVVDDEQTHLLLFKAVFGQYYEVREALSAHDALEILRRETIHLLVTDQCMPAMTGAELLAETREEFPDIGRVMLTAYSDVDAIVQAVNAGHLDYYATKPWRSAELRAIIDRVLEKAEHRRRRRRLIRELRQMAEREEGLRETMRKHMSASVLEELMAGDDP